MITMRLMRFGAKKRPSYRIVVIDSKRARESQALDSLGYYNPLENPAEISFDEEKVKHWLSRGARPSKTVQSLLDRSAVSKKQTQATLS
jgi:small subunit ribosomal protein S16